ncbi:type III pantothenate kinase [uncultured Neptuniibacter sp.]|uniref:type III pantothenate kinase n=1 Tax=uncultured Neptuniibacter sp. TaxID=502143 RepID=UPI00260D5DD7|nr:type III pantothenate kinase [uncultured Neptuniibacter sp.]
MILEFDAGNTFIKWRTLGGNVNHQGRMLTRDLTSIELPCADTLSKIELVRIASVAGDLVNQQLQQKIIASGLPLPVFAVTQRESHGVINSYTDPSRMGVDRWLAMLAAYRRCQRACCVVDCGSAITVDYLAEGGKHLGGYIIPGLRLMQKALLANTAEILVDNDIAMFDNSPGRSTSEAVIHGINFAFDALVKSVVDKRSSEMDLLITGGDGELFFKLAGCGEYIPDLVMDGLVWGCE